MGDKKEMRLDIGCGATKKEGYIGIDVVDHSKLYKKGEFIKADIDKKGIPFPSNSIDRVFSRESLEHFRNFDFVMGEIVRVCRNNAKVEIIVPHNVSESAFYEKHHTFFRSKSFRGEYEKDFLPYEVEKVRILFWKKPFMLFFCNYFFEWLFNLHPLIFDFYHKTGLRYIFPAWWLHFRLRIRK